MNKKVFVLLCVPVILVSLILGGIRIMPEIAHRAIQEALGSINTFLHDRYAKGLLVANLRLDFEPCEESFLSESGIIRVSADNYSTEYELPLNISYGVLTADIEADFYNILDGFLIKKSFLGENSHSTGLLHIRAFPKSWYVRADILAEYSKFLQQEGLIGVDKEGFLPLVGRYYAIPDGERGVSHLLVLKNVFIPGISFRELDLNSKFIFKDGLGYPSNANIKFSKFYHYAFELGFFDDLNIDVYSKEKKNNLSFDISADGRTPSGDFVFDGKIGQFSLEKISSSNESWLHLCLNPEDLYSYFKDNSGKFTLDDFELNALVNTDRGSLKYTAKARGYLDFLDTKGAFEDAVSKADGEFDISFSNMNEIGRSFVKSVGQGFLSEHNDELSTKIVVEKGSMSFTQKNF